MAGRGPGGPSKAQQDQWNEKAMQLMKRHDQNGDGLLEPREMASAINELCGTHGFSARSLTAALGLDPKLENAAYRWSPVEFSDVYRRAMLMADTGGGSGGGGGGGGGGGAGADRLMGQAVDALRDLDAKSEANLKQCYANYCRLTVAGGGKMMMDGDLKISSAQWHQLCADVGLAQPVGPVSPTDLASIFSTASQRTSGLTLKQFLTALAMISPDLTTLTNHIVAQLGPQLRPRAGGDAPQAACFPLRNLDLKSQGAQAHWGAAQGVMSAANAFMKAGNHNLGGNGGGGGGGGGGGSGGFAGSVIAALQNAGSGGGYSIEIEESLSRNRAGSGFASPAQAAGMRQSLQQEQLSPIVGGPITAKLGGGGMKRSSLTSVGGALGGGGLSGGLSSGLRSVGSAGGQKSLDMPSNQMVLLDRLAAAEARITQLEQQQSFTREMMQAASAGGTMSFGAGGGHGSGGGGGGDGMASASLPQMMALEAKFCVLEEQLQRVAPGADAPRLIAEVRDNLELLANKVEALTKTVERASKRIDSCEEKSKHAEEGVRALQAPIQEATSGLSSLRTVTDQLKSGVVSKETELMTTLVSRIGTAESNIEAVDGQLRKMIRDSKVSAALPSRDTIMAAMAAGGGGGEQQAAGGGPLAPSTPTSNGPSDIPKEVNIPNSVGQLKPGGPGAPGGEKKGDDYFVQTLGVVNLDSEEDIRLQIKLLCEAMDNTKRRVNQIAGSNQLNPIDFPTRNELNEVKKVIMGDISDIDAKYIKIQKDVNALSLKMPVLEKKVESSALGSGTEVVNRLVSMGMARLADVKDTENYMVDRGQGVTKQFDNLKRDMQDFQGDLQANMEKLVTQFNQINKQLQDARRDAQAPATSLVAAAVAGQGGGGSAASNSTAATAASAAATAAQTASDARSAVERERTDREREVREIRERLARTESHLGGALGELQTVVGAELSNIKEVLTQIEAAMNQADGDLMRLLRELDGSLRGAMSSLERGTGEQNEMTGKVIMKMARQITEMQVKLREMATNMSSGGGGGGGGNQHSPMPSPSGQQQSHQQQQQQQQMPMQMQLQQQQLQSRDSDSQLPFAARLLAQQQQGGSGGGGSGGGGGAEGAPASPSLAQRIIGAARTSVNGSAGGLLQGRAASPLTADMANGGGSGGGGSGGRNVGQSPARGSLASDPPPPPGGVRMPRLSDAGGRR